MIKFVQFWDGRMFFKVTPLWIKGRRPTSTLIPIV